MVQSIDLGGNNLIVDNIYYGATGPGQSGVIASLQNPNLLSFTATGCNLDATNATDIAIFNIVLPTGYTRYIPTQLVVSHASHTLATAVLGIYTAASAGGTAVEASIALTNLTATTDATNLNTLVTTVTDSTSRSWTLATYPTLYVNLVTQEGAAATADITLVVQPIP